LSRSDLRLSRRAAILGAAAAAVARPTIADPFPRIAAIDWAMLETVMALGVPPMAASELIRFREDAVEPQLPASVIDLGLRGSPNLELLHLLKPDLILLSPFYVRHEAGLRAIAPTISLPFYVRGEPPFEKALAAVDALGIKLDRKEEAARVRAATTSTLGALRQKLTSFAERPTYLINIGDARHARVFGADSMFGDVLGRLGLPNAWTERSRYTFAAPVPLENLSAREDARIVIISDIPVEARAGLRGSMIWNSLGPVRSGRVAALGRSAPMEASRPDCASRACSPMR
jgi:iron complex transport system substrate-binding protein